jgi:hypothetical protein
VTGKHIAGRTQLKAIVDIVLSAKESSCVRRLCIEALDRLSFARHIGWHDIHAVIHAIKNDADMNIREGMAGLVGALPDSTEKFSILIIFKARLTCNVSHGRQHDVSCRHASC